MKARPFFALSLNWVIVAVLCAAAYFVFYSVPLSSLAPDPSLARWHTVARSIAMLLLTLSTVSAVLIVVAIIACLRDPEVPGPYIVWVGFACMAPFFAYVGVNLSTWPMHRRALERAAAQGAEVITAIERYSAEHGEPPESISNAPTSLAAYPAFSYTRFTPKDARRTLWWYDLGVRHGRTVVADWSYPDGQLSHAILAVELDGEDTVTRIVADRASLDMKPMLFDEATWQARTAARQAMVADIVKRFEHASKAALSAALGQPDGERLLVDTPWELWVRTFPSDVDRFFYWPTKHYPPVLGNRSVMAVGDWAYARD